MWRWTVGVMLTCVGCGGGELIAPPADGPFEYAFADALADTTRPTTPDANRAADALGIVGTVSTTDLVIRLRFAEEIAPWSSGSANGIDGFVDLDVDENELSGIPGAADDTGGDAGLGADYYISLRDNGAGSMALIHATEGTFQLVPVTFYARAIEIQIARNLIGENDGRFRLGAVVGVPGRPVTDYVPDTGHYTVHLPE